MGDIETAFQFLRINPHSLKDPELFELVLTICAMHDHSRGLLRLGMLVSQRSTQADPLSLKKLVDYLIRLKEYTMALDLITQCKVLDSVNGLIHATILNRPDVALAALELNPKIQLRSGFISKLFQYAIDTDLVGKVPFFYRQLDVSVLLPSQHQKMLDLSMAADDKRAISLIIKTCARIGVRLNAKGVKYASLAGAGNQRDTAFL
jgi:hypothetical protein